MRLPWKKRPSATPPNLDTMKEYVVGMQRDGRLLLRYLARRSDCVLPPVGPAGLAFNGVPSHVLFDSADTVARSTRAITELVSCVDQLGRQAAPTNVRSIRLTSAYLGMTQEDGEPPREVSREARGVKWSMRFIGYFVALPFLLLSVLILFHVDYGRRMLAQLDGLRKQEIVLRDEIGRSPAVDWEMPAAKTGVKVAATTKPAPPAKPAVETGAGRCAPTRQSETFVVPAKQSAVELCRRYDDLQQRLQLVYVGFADWNCRTNYLLSPIEAALSWPTGLPTNVAACEQPISTLPRGTDATTWQSHEIRVSNMIGVVGGFVLPLLLGCVGGCTHVLRRHVDRLRTWTVEPYDGRSALIRVALAGTLGGLVGVIWSSDQPVTLSGFSLSLAALAFFIGFSVETVFKLIERITTTVAATAQDTPAAAPLPPVVMLPRTDVPANDRTGTPLLGADKPPLRLTTDASGVRAQLAQAAQDLKDHRQSLAAMAQAGAGVPVVANAPALIGDIDKTLVALQPVLADTADPASLDRALTQAQDTLKTAEDAGLPGILADSAATLKGALDFAKPVLAGIPGGPFGIVAGIVLGGLKLFDNQQQFQALKSALLRQPFDPAVNQTVPSAATALAALAAAPLMKSHVQALADIPDFAVGLMQAMLQVRPDKTLLATSDLVGDLMGPDTRQLGLRQRFESAGELAQAIDEYRGATVFADALNRLDTSVAVPALADAPAATVALRDVAKAALEAGTNPRAASVIEQLVSLTESLAKTPSGPQAVVDFVTRALTKVPNLVQTARVAGAAA